MASSIYSIPQSWIVNDGQGFALIVDRTDGMFWVSVRGGIASSEHAFGPGTLP